MTLFASPLDRAVVGVDPGWRAVFRPGGDRGPDRDAEPLVLDHRAYRAQARVSRSAALRAPTFELSVDGLGQDDRSRILTRRLLYLELWLGWRDLADGGGQALGAALGGLLDLGRGDLHPVIVARVVDVSTSAGDFLERTTFRGVGAGHHRLATAAAPALSDEGGARAHDVAAATARPFVDDVDPHDAGDLPELSAPPVLPADASALQALAEVCRRGHATGDDRSLPAFFRVREGDPPLEVLHVGHWDKPIGATHPLDVGTGLAEVRPVLQERGADHRADPFAALAAADLEYDVVLLGRPDIAVADVVTLELDELTGGAALDSVLDTVGLSLAGEQPTAFDVVGVQHALGHDTGFVTTLHVAPHPQTPTRRRLEEADEAHAVASRIAAQRRAIELRMWDVGVVRAQHARDGDDGGRPVHAQRRDIESGLEPSASPARIVNAALNETTTGLRDRPYLTPFAWQGAGLVLPHYPGTRVVDLHYRGLTAEGAIAGCVWEEGREPPAENGDWWLCLPTGVAEPERAGAVREIADLPAGTPGAHDLTDADGGRSVHVAGLRITLGTGLMPAVGTRPDDPPQGSLEIRHEANNARIVIDDAGNIEIATDGDLTLRANAVRAHVADVFEVL